MKSKRMVYWCLTCSKLDCSRTSHDRMVSDTAENLVKMGYKLDSGAATRLDKEAKESNTQGVQPLR